MNKFNDDLKKGRGGEVKIKEYLERRGLTFVSWNDDIRWDLVMMSGDKILKYEIKTDEYEKFKGETGNIFIEFSCSGKKSGIYASEADYYVYYFPQMRKAYFTSKAVLLANRHLFHISYGGGDNGTVKGFLVDRKEFDYLFTIITIHG
jgi:hypothetical protein